MRRSLARCGPVAVIAVLLVALAVGCSDNSKTTVNRPDNTDPQPPMSPTALDWTSPSLGMVQILWDPSSDPDVVGYNVYRFDPSPDRLQSYQQLNTGLIHDTQYTIYDSEPNTDVYYRASAVDASGNESALSEPVKTNLLVSGYDVPPLHEPPPSDTP